MDAVERSRMWQPGLARSESRARESDMEKCYRGGRYPFSPPGVAIETGHGCAVSLFWHFRITVSTTSKLPAGPRLVAQRFAGGVRPGTTQGNP